MKQATKKATETAEQTIESVNSVIGLSQKTASVALKSAVQTTQVAEGYVQGLYKVGYDTQIAGMEVAKGYWDGMTQIRQEWVKLFAETGEKAIASTSDLEFPFQKETLAFSKNLFESTQKVVENFTAPLRNTTK